MTDYRITADWNDLIAHAGATAERFLADGIEAVAHMTGDEDAWKTQPELVQAYVNAASTNFLAASITVAAQENIGRPWKAQFLGGLD